jgi:hypothetical protein
MSCVPTNVVSNRDSASLQYRKNAKPKWSADALKGTANASPFLLRPLPCNRACIVIKNEEELRLLLLCVQGKTVPK